MQKDWCRDHAWSAPGVYTHACYSDIPPLYYGRGLAAGDVPYIGQAARPAGRVPGADRHGDVAVGQAGPVVGRRRASAPSGTSTSTRSGSRWPPGSQSRATALLAGRRPWDAAMFAVAPTLALAATINWDLYAVALLSLGMLAWAREKPAAAGVLIGLAAATKFYPLFLLGPLLVLCLRAGRMREYWTALAAAACGVGSGQRAVHAGRLRRVVEVLPAVAGAGRRLRLDLVRAEPAGSRSAGRRAEPDRGRAVRAGLCGHRGARAGRATAGRGCRSWRSSSSRRSC